MSQGQPETTDFRLAAAMLIVSRCREEGRHARRSGLKRSANPYSRGGDQELESAGWDDGWSREGSA